MNKKLKPVAWQICDQQLVTRLTEANALMEKCAGSIQALFDNDSYKLKNCRFDADISTSARNLLWTLRNHLVQIDLITGGGDLYGDKDRAHVTEEDYDDTDMRETLKGDQLRT